MLLTFCICYNTVNTRANLQRLDLLLKQGTLLFRLCHDGKGAKKFLIVTEIPCLKIVQLDFEFSDRFFYCM